MKRRAFLKSVGLAVAIGLASVALNTSRLAVSGKTWIYLDGEHYGTLPFALPQMEILGVDVFGLLPRDWKQHMLHVATTDNVSAGCRFKQANHEGPNFKGTIGPAWLTRSGG